MTSAILRIDKVHAPGGDTYGRSDMYITMRQARGGIYIRTAVQLDRDTAEIPGEYLFRDTDEAVELVAWDADHISSDDVLDKYTVPLNADGPGRLESATGGYLEYTVYRVELVDPAHQRHLEAVAALVSGFLQDVRDLDKV